MLFALAVATLLAAPQAAPKTLVEATPVALEAICTVSPSERTPDALRAEAAETGFQFWGDFFEIEARDGTLDVRPGAVAADACGLDYMTARDRVWAVDRALSDWAEGLGFVRDGADVWTEGVVTRRYAGAEGGLTWTVTPSAAPEEPALITATLDLADR